MISEYIEFLSSLPDPFFTKVMTTDTSGNPKIVLGLDGFINLDYYSISQKQDVMVSELGNIGSKKIKEIWQLDENGDLTTRITDLSTKIDRAYRIIRNDRTGDYALAEVCYFKKTKNPVGYSDGIIIGGSLFSNALISEHYGHLLDSQFYDTDTKRFNLKSEDDFKKDFLKGENIIDGYKSRLLFVISETDRSQYRNTLIDLNVIDRYFATGDNKFDPEIKDPFSGIDRSKLKEIESELVTTPPSAELIDMPIKSHGILEVITIENLVKLYYHQFEAQKGSRKRYYDYFLLGLLGQVNLAFDPIAKYIDWDSKRDQEDVEGIINELIAKTDIDNFLLRDSTGTPIKLYLKRWMAMIYDKIYIDKDNYYQGTNRFILEARNRIVDLSDPESPKNLIQRPDIGADEKYFDGGADIKAGKELLKVFQRLFGHETLRFILLRRLELYSTSDGRIKIIPISGGQTQKELEDILKDLNFMAPTQEVLKSMDRRHMARHLPSLMFGKSFLYLPVKNIKETFNENNKVEFACTPFTSDGVNVIASGTSNIKEYSKKLKAVFDSHFKVYTSSNPLVKRFTDSGILLMVALSDVIEHSIRNDGSIDKNNKDVFIGEVIKAAEEEIFDPKTKAINLRQQIEVWLNSKDEKVELQIGKVPATQWQPDRYLYKIELSKTQLLEIFQRKGLQAGFNLFQEKLNVRVKSGELSWSKILELIDLYLSEREDED